MALPMSGTVSVFSNTKAPRALDNIGLGLYHLYMKYIYMIILTALAAVGASAGDMGESLYFGTNTHYRLIDAQPSKSPGPVYASGSSEQPSKPYDVLILNGILPDKNARLQVLVDGKWTDMYLKRMDNGRFWSRYDFTSPRRSPVSFRVYSNGAASGSKIEIFDTEVFLVADTYRDEVTVSSGTTLSTETVTIPPPPTIPGITLISRATWGAKPATANYLEHTPSTFTVHHTEGAQPMTEADAIKEMQFIQDFHQNTRKWIDIAYHFLIDGQGNIYQGRPVNVVGSHVKNKNTNNVGISVMGNFQPPSKGQPTQAQLDAVVKIIHGVTQLYNISMTRLYAHREEEATDCPGDTLYAEFQMMRQQLQKEQGVPVTPLVDSSTQKPAVPADPAQANPPEVSTDTVNVNLDSLNSLKAFGMQSQ